MVVAIRSLGAYLPPRQDASTLAGAMLLCLVPASLPCHAPFAMFNPASPLPHLLCSQQLLLHHRRSNRAISMVLNIEHHHPLLSATVKSRPVSHIRRKCSITIPCPRSPLHLCAAN